MSPGGFLLVSVAVLPAGMEECNNAQIWFGHILIDLSLFASWNIEPVGPARGFSRTLLLLLLFSHFFLLARSNVLNRPKGSVSFSVSNL